MRKVLGKISRPVALIVGFILTLQLASCKDSGSVGSRIGDPSSDLKVDTMAVSQLQADSLLSYSGNRAYLSVGRFQDPLFGTLNATALLKPLLGTNNGTSFFDDTTSMKLRLSINKETVYGDTLAEASFDIVEIAELWRGPAWKLDDEIDLVAGSTVASFTVSDQDSMDIPLSSAWVDKYGEYYSNTNSNRDSLYIRELYGLAIVPQNSGKIITIEGNGTRFIANDVVNLSSDSLVIGLRDVAYSLDRSNAETDAESSKTYNTLEKVLTFNFDFTSTNIQSNTIAKAELLIYRDNLLLNETIAQAGATAVRPPLTPLRLHLVEGDELPQSIDPGSALATGVYQDEDEAYHFNLTGLINQGVFDNVDSTFRFFITQGTNDGTIRSNVVFNDEAGTMKSPKVIITSTNNR